MFIVLSAFILHFQRMFEINGNVTLIFYRRFNLRFGIFGRWNFLFASRQSSHNFKIQQSLQIAKDAKKILDANQKLIRPTNNIYIRCYRYSTIELIEKLWNRLLIKCKILQI